jgi:hypothetical protein
VVNPYAEQLSFHAAQARARRDHEKYLALIDTIALLHQHQREIHQVTSGERCIEYIEVTRADIEAAHAIAHEVLGRSLDELPPVTRKLLATLSDYVAERAKLEGVQRDELRFTRRELREACGWGDTQLRLHLQRLAELEILNTERMGAGGQLRYTLRHEAGEQDARTRLCGLIDPAQLRDAAMTEKSRGSEAQAAGPSRGDRGPDAGALRASGSAEKPATARPGAIRPDAQAASHIKADPRSASSYLQAAA